MGKRGRSHGAAPQPRCPRGAPPPDLVPLLVTVVGGNAVTATAVLECLNTVDATVLRRLHPAIAMAVAEVPWADTTTLVCDIAAWRAALPAAVGCKLTGSRSVFDRSTGTSIPVREAFGDADMALLPPTLRSLDVSFCRGLTQDVSFAHLPVLNRLDCRSTFVVAGGVACLPPSLRELRLDFTSPHKAADFSRFRALRVLECHAMYNGTLSSTAIASLPPSLEVFHNSGNSDSEWPSDGSLAHLPRLRHLRAPDTCIPAAVLTTLPPSLQCLDLEACTLTGTTLVSFAHLNCLHTLSITNSNIDDAMLTTLPPSLVSLELQVDRMAWERRLTPAAVFPHLPALRLLNVSGTSIGDAAVASMPPGLEKLHMVDCFNVTRRATLDHLTALRVLHSSGTEMSPAVIASCRARGCVAPFHGVVAAATECAVQVALLPDGRLVSSTPTGRVALWATDYGGTPLGEVQIGDPTQPARGARVLAVLPDRHCVAIARSGSKTAPSGIFIWDTRNAPHAAGAITHATIEFVDKLTALTALPNGHLAAGFDDGALRIVDVDTRVVLVTLEGHTDRVVALAVLPDGRLASASWDHTVRLWDVGARVCVATLVGHTNHVTSLVALPDGRLASGSFDGTVRLWDVGSHVCVGVLQGHMRALATLPGSNRLVGMSCDDELRMWNTDDAADVLPPLTVELAGSAAGVLVPLPDGRLATGGRGVRLWQLPPLGGAGTSVAAQSTRPPRLPCIIEGQQLPGSLKCQCHARSGCHTANRRDQHRGRRSTHNTIVHTQCLRRKVQPPRGERAGRRM